MTNKSGRIREKRWLRKTVGELRLKRMERDRLLETMRRSVRLSKDEKFQEKRTNEPSELVVS